MRLSEIKQFLAERNLQLTKSLGQNFLHDANQLRRIVEAAELNSRDRVLEIGPGLGALTELLVQRAGEVLAIEKDERLVQCLRERFGVAETVEAPQTLSGPGSEGQGRLSLIHADALEYLRETRRDCSGWKLVSNLPYSVASPILVELAQSATGPERMVATVQMEVARRLMARAGEEDYGLLTLLVQLNYAPVDWFKISSSCFFPEPDVDSACVRLFRREQPLLGEAQAEVFTQIIKRSFSQRRKMMLKLLKEDWAVSALEAAFEKLHLGLRIRAEEVSLEQFVRLTQLLTASSKDGRRDL